MTRLLAWVAGAAFVSCSSAPPPPVVAPSPPPRDDGRPSRGGDRGASHSAALEQLKGAAFAVRHDRQESIGIPLPDGQRWTRVSFWGLPSLVGFRYGKGHHAIVAAYVTHVADPRAPGACTKSFEEWASPVAESFDIDVRYEAPQGFLWRDVPTSAQVVWAKTATLADRDGYAGVYATYPAWTGACLIVGVVVPSREDPVRAREVRDRFAREVLPKVEVRSAREPPERY